MKAFVIMPFSSSFDDIYSIGIKETANKEGVNAYRLDEEIFNEGMLDKIYKEIEDCDFIIADLSTKNANVFYELGYAHALNKFTILLTKVADDIPFDLKHKKHIIYGDSIQYLKTQLTENIKWVKKELEQQNTIPLEITLKSSSILNITDSMAEADIDFKIDIENTSEKKAIEVQAIYIYSSSKWNITQNGLVIPSKDSDIKNYSFKYLVSLDTYKIPKGGWRQIGVNAKRGLAYSWKGEEIKDSYKVNGNLLIEIATDKGAYTKKIPLNLNISDLPF